MAHLPGRPRVYREALLHGHLKKGWGMGVAISGDDCGRPEVSR